MSKYWPDSKENVGGPQAITKELFNSLIKLDRNVSLYSYKKHKSRNKILLPFKIILDIFSFRSEFDVINIDSSSFNFAILFGIINMLLRIPTVLTVHGYPMAEKEQKGLKQFSLNIRFIIMLHMYKHFIMVSYYLKNSLIKKVPFLNKIKNNIFVIHNGVKDIYINSNHDKPNKNIYEPFKLLFVGGIKEGKGALFIIDSLSKLNHHIHWLLQIAGHIDKKTEKIFTTKISNFNVEKQIQKLGWLSEQQLAYNYINADVILAPSRYETFNVAVLEAMACSKVVITTKTSGVSEILSNWYDAVIIDYGDEKGLLNAIIELHNDNNLRESIGKNAKYTACQYNWDNISRKYLDVYENLFNSK